MDYRQKAKDLKNALYGIWSLYELVTIKEGGDWFHYYSKHPLIHDWYVNGDYWTCKECGKQLHYRLKLTGK
jgi:hypothetical protein